jgi:DNA modification methylase
MSRIPKPTLRDVLNTYRVGDARRLFQSLPEREFVDVTITSPPYWNLKDYGVKKQIGFGQTYEACINDLRLVFQSVYSATKPSGSLWIVADTIKDNGKLRLFPFDLAAELQKIGWILHDIIVWHKDKTLPWSHRGKLRNIFEYVLFFTKSKDFKYYLANVRDTEDLKPWWVRYPERYSPLGKAPSRTWSIPIPRQGSWGDNWVRHYCPLPPDLVRRMVLLTTEPQDVVLDPFSGSGVVLAQAAAMKRRFVGLDISGRYRSVFRKQVLPSIQKLEAEHARVSSNGHDRRKVFEESIWVLRKLKVARELQRLYESEYGKLNARALFVSSNGERAITVISVFPDNVRGLRGIASDLDKLLLRPPLSKYELKVELLTVRQSEFLSNGLIGQHLSGGANLYLYKDGLTFRSADRLPVGSIFTPEKGNGVEGAPRFAPILSNIEPDTLLKTLR